MEVKNNLTQCPQGHFYNAAIYSRCPHCDGTLPEHFSETVDLGNANPQADTAGGFPPTMSPVMESSGGYRSLNSQGSDNMNPFSSPTIIGGEAAAENQVEPVVGWLVCIDGSVKGTDFRIHAGYNYIGREIGDIHIQGDLQISRQNHAMIAFDSSDGVYYVGPSAGRNLMKVNGKTILNAVEIKSYDVISIGNTKLMFVALCGPHFDWNKEVEL